jgi:hypothetical protein
MARDGAYGRRSRCAALEGADAELSPRRLRGRPSLLRFRACARGLPRPGRTKRLPRRPLERRAPQVNHSGVVRLRLVIVLVVLAAVGLLAGTAVPRGSAAGATTPTATTTTTTTPVCICGYHRAPLRRGGVRAAINHERPVAGKTFKGLTFRLLSGYRRFSRVQCDAKVARKRLPARQQSSFIGDVRVTVVCAWRIPADAGGERLRLWPYESGGKARAWVVHMLPRGIKTGRAGSTSWLVKQKASG